MGRIGRLLKKLRGEYNLDQIDLAKKLGYSRAYIAMLETGKVNTPSLAFIKILATEFNLDRSELEKLREMDKRDEEMRKGIPIRKVPVLNSISAGDLLRWTDKEYPPGWADEWIEIDSGVTDPNAFALRVDGDSMEPEFHEGEYVVVSPNTQWENGDYVVIANCNDEKALKKIKVNKDHIVLISLNPKYEPIILSKNENPRVIGKVVRKVKKY